MMNKKIPKHIDLTNELLSWLETDKLKSGDKVPSEHQLAEQFGLSRQTVRQALSCLENEGWLKRIQGKGTFVRNRMSPAVEDAKTIGIITTYISDYIFPDIVRGAESELRSRGYRLLLSSTDNNKDKERECLELMMSQPISGLIIEPTKSAEDNPNLAYFLTLNENKIPYLMINERYRELECPCLKVDDERGGYLAAAHLIEQGHRSIAGIFKTDDLQGVNRLKGFLKAQGSADLSTQAEHVITYTTEQSMDDICESALHLLQKPTRRPTAFVCYNDETAAQLIEAVKQTGLSVPDDLSVIGFDNSRLALTSKLTTLTHPKENMGIAAAQQLIDMIENADAGLTNVLYDPKLIERESVSRKGVINHA